MEIADVFGYLGQSDAPRLVQPPGVRLTGKHTSTVRSAELWMRAHLSECGADWRARAPGWLWSHERGILIKLVVDGVEPVACDEHAAFDNRGVLILRVTAFDEDSAVEAMHAVATASPWDERRRAIGLPALKPDYGD